MHLKAFLIDSSPGKLVRASTRHAHYALKEASNGRKLRGVEKRLHLHLFSKGTFPSHALHGGQSRQGWGGIGGGRRRGRAVDAQVSRLVNASSSSFSSLQMRPTLKYAKNTFHALREMDLKPILAQRVLAQEELRLGTACDLICLRGANELVIVELKCGYAGDKNVAAHVGGESQYMQSPCSTALDTILNRHLAQVAATYFLFSSERDTVSRLNAMGIQKISAVLLYINDKGSELHSLNKWWIRRGKRIIVSLR